MTKKARTYSEISSNYNPELRLKYFDIYRNGITRKDNLNELIRARCYVIDENSSSSTGGVKHKQIEVNIEGIERVIENGELLFRCTCNPEDYVVLKNDEENQKPYKKSFFHRLERMMIEVL